MECMLNIWTNDTRDSDAVKTAAKTCRSFKSLTRIRLPALNQFLKESQKQVVRCSARLDFWWLDQTNFINGFFVRLVSSASSMLLTLTLLI